MKNCPVHQLHWYPLFFFHLFLMLNGAYVLHYSFVKERRLVHNATISQQIDECLIDSVRRSRFYCLFKDNCVDALNCDRCSPPSYSINVAANFYSQFIELVSRLPFVLAIFFFFFFFFLLMAKARK